MLEVDKAVWQSTHGASTDALGDAGKKKPRKHKRDLPSAAKRKAKKLQQHIVGCEGIPLGGGLGGTGEEADKCEDRGHSLALWVQSTHTACAWLGCLIIVFEMSEKDTGSPTKRTKRTNIIPLLKTLYHMTMEDTLDPSAFDASAWERIDQLVKRHGMIRHQRESFDYFMSTLLPYIISENSDCWSTSSDGNSKHCIHFQNVHIMRPSIQEFDGFEQEITPNAARLRGMTYASNVMIEAVVDSIDCSGEEPKVIQRTHYPNLLLCRIPVMVNSSFCHLRVHSNGRASECMYYEGGYFIINGVEKCLLAQE